LGWLKQNERETLIGCLGWYYWVNETKAITPIRLGWKTKKTVGLSLMLGYWVGLLGLATGLLILLLGWVQY